MNRACAALPLAFFFVSFTSILRPQASAASPTVAGFLKVQVQPGQSIVLEPVRAIDCTGAAERNNQTIVLRDGKIEQVLARADIISRSVDGIVAPAKIADLVIVRGDPFRAIEDFEDVEIVFKDGQGFDAAKLLDSKRGRYGQY